MKKIAGLMIISFCFCLCLSAQIQRKVPDSIIHDQGVLNDGMKTNNQSSKKQTQLKMLQALNLTKEQKGSLKEIRQVNQSKRESIQNDATLSQVEKEAKLTEIKRQSAASLQDILTDEQKLKMKAMLKDRQKTGDPLDTIEN